MIKAGQYVVCVTGHYKTVKDFEVCKVNSVYNGMLTLVGHGNRRYRTKDFFKYTGD